MVIFASSWKVRMLSAEAWGLDASGWLVSTSSARPGPGALEALNTLRQRQGPLGPRKKSNSVSGELYWVYWFPPESWTPRTSDCDLILKLGLFADVTRSGSWDEIIINLGQALNPKAVVLIRREDPERHPEKGATWRQEERVTLPQPRHVQGPRGWRRTGWILPGAARGGSALLTLRFWGFWPLELWDSKFIIV